MYETEFRFPRQDRGFRGGSVGANRDTEDKTTAVATEKEEDAENGRAQEEEEEEDEGESPELALRVISVKILSFFMFIMCKMIESGIETGSNIAPFQSYRCSVHVDAFANLQTTLKLEAST